MPSHIEISGKEVTNPLGKAAIGALAILIVGLIATAVIFLVLPLVGIAVTLTVGLMGVILVALGIGVPVLILGGSLLGALLMPFAALRDRRKNTKDRR